MAFGKAVHRPIAGKSIQHIASAAEMSCLLLNSVGPGTLESKETNKEPP